MFKKIIRGCDLRKTRFHDEKGNLVGWSGLLNAPKAFMSGFARVIFNRRPNLPWISYNAIRDLNIIMRPNWSVIEFGSGSSTAWLAKRCKTLYSIEDNREWFEYVSAQLVNKGCDNVNYVLQSGASYSDLSDFEDGSIDFALIDGLNPADCMRQVIPKIKPGGYVYLDNSDKYADTLDGDIRIAEKILLEAVLRRNGQVKYFVDFAPSQFFVNEGVLAKI